MSCNALGVIHCTGMDAEKFLQGQLSADISALTQTQGALACYLNLKGRVVACMFIIKRLDGFWLVMPTEIIPVLLHKLHKVIAFSKATLADLSKQFNVEDDVTHPLSVPAYHVDITDDVVTFCVQPQHGISIRITPATDGPFKLPDDFLRILLESRFPWIGKAQSEKFLPHYIDLVALHAISFDKGCFVGQEVVARMEYRGHLNKKLAVMRMPLGTELDIDGPVMKDNKTIGQVVNMIADEDQLLILASVG